MNDYLDTAAGAAHAILFAVFLVSGTGKLVGCRNGSRIMCAKAGLDFTLALAAGIFWSGWIAAPACLVIAAIGALGWLRERLRNDPVCNCFGVLSAPLSGARNVARCAMLGCAALILARLAVAGGALAATPAALGGAVAGMAMVLAGVTYALAANAGARKRAPAARHIAEPPVDTVFARADHAGTDRDGRALSIADLLHRERPLAIVLVSKGCPPCEELKREFAASAHQFPFPLYLVSDGEAGPGDSANVLFDGERTLRAKAAVFGTPSMLLIDPATLRITRPVVGGAPEIRRVLLDLLLASAGPAYTAQQVEPSVAQARRAS